MSNPYEPIKMARQSPVVPASGSMVRMSKSPHELYHELHALRQQYHQLLYAVGNVYPGETRHQTALRYIRQAEERGGEACAPPPGMGGQAETKGEGR